MSGELTTFRTKPSFQFFYFLPALLAVALAVDAVIAPDRTKAFAIVLVVILAALTVPMGLARVAVDGKHLTLRAPLRRPRTVDLRQVIGVEESSRLWQRLILRYHPTDPRGRPDPTIEAFLSLPPVEEQVALEELLRGAWTSKL